LSISTPDFKSPEEQNEGLLRLDLDDEILRVIHKALDEDIGAGDVTTNAIVAQEASATAQIIAKQEWYFIRIVDCSGGLPDAGW
jgi:hypothetical protein